LFQNRAERTFRHVAGMIWDSRIAACGRVVPDLMTAGSLPINWNPRAFSFRTISR
jgi:hypothetical protein